MSEQTATGRSMFKAAAQARKAERDRILAALASPDEGMVRAVAHSAAILNVSARQALQAAAIHLREGEGASDTSSRTP